MGVVDFEHMKDRPLRQSTGWVEAQTVLGVPQEATPVLGFGSAS